MPRQWKVVQIVREKFTCRDCEKISQAPAPFAVLPRGFAGPSLLAMILFEKYGQHQPLNRQSERYAREGIDLSVSTLADQIGGCAVLLRPLYELIRFVEIWHEENFIEVESEGANNVGRSSACETSTHSRYCYSLRRRDSTCVLADNIRA